MTESIAEKSRCKRIGEYLPLIRAANGLTLGQVCSLCELESTTIQNWIKRGYVPHPVRKKYRERHLARILLISELRESMPIDRVGALLRYVNGDADDESDDIITEEALYDLYREMTERLDQLQPAPEGVEEAASAIVCELIPGDPALGRITNALCVMAAGYMSSRYKQAADSLFNTYVIS